MNVNRRSFITRAVAAYVVAALAWVFLSDQLLTVFVDVSSLVWLSTAKGVFFVLVSGGCFAIALNAVPGRTPASLVHDQILLDALTYRPGARWFVYLFAIALTVAMVLVHLLMHGPADQPFLLLYMLPIMLAALLGGVGPGLTATLTAAVLSFFFFTTPHPWSTHSTTHELTTHDLFHWSFLLINGLVISLISEGIRRLRQCEAGRLRIVEQTLIALRESEERLSVFIEHAPAALAMFDHGMRYLAASRRWRDDYRLGQQPLIGQSHYDIFPEIGEALQAIHRRGLKGEIIRFDEDRFERQDGTVQWLCWEVRPWHTVSGEVGGIVIFSEDISRFKKAEEEIHRLNAELEQRVVERTTELIAANRELDSFAYAVSHDLRAPLRAMNGFSQALIEDYGEQLQGEARMYLDQIILGSRKMGELIDGLLTLSRSTRGQVHHDRLDLSAMALRLLTALAQEDPERHVDWEIEPDMILCGDASMLEVVMRNLLANAWKYTSRRDPAVIRVYTVAGAHGVTLCIADNGAGFDPAYADKLFQPFQRLHRQEEFPGIGIGLATVQRIIHRHGGTITAQGKKEQGATFCFTLQKR